MRLVINSGKAKGRIINVIGSRLLIGRDPECQLRPQSEDVSGRHAELKFISGIALIFDLNSAGGTRVNGRRITGPATLKNGDRVEIGPLSLTILLDEAKRAAKPKRTTEDEVASWLVDDEDDEPSSSWTRQDVDRGIERPAQASAGTSTPKRAASPAGSSDQDAIALLKAMSVRAE